MGRASRAKRKRRETGEDPRRKRKPLLARSDPKTGKPPRPRWQGEPCLARRCLVVIARDADGPAAKLAGRERRVVEVTLHFLGGEVDRVFYIDDEELAPDDRVEDDLLAEQIRAAGDELGIELDRQWGYPGWGWQKVTHGRGDPRYGHLELSVDRVLTYLDNPEEDLEEPPPTDVLRPEGEAA